MNMKRQVRRWTAWALAVIMLMTLTGAQPALAAGAAALGQGTESLKADANTKNAATVWYGGRAWRVIGYDGSGVAGPAGSMTLLCVGNAAWTQFDVDGSKSNAYGVSTLKTEVEKIAAGFSAGERGTVLPRTLAGGSVNFGQEGFDGSGIAGQSVKNALLWPLSVNEAKALKGGLRVADPEKTEYFVGHWWLRSPGGTEARTAYVSSAGAVENEGYDVRLIPGMGVRPAFYIDLDSVILTSAAKGGKTSGSLGASALKKVPAATGSEWKLTVKDAAHNKFSASLKSGGTGTAVISYSGAATGKNEYISAVITDKDGRITYYGRLAKASAGGTVSVDYSGKLAAGGRLYVFNEQVNAQTATDYASRLILIQVIPTSITNSKLTGLSDKIFSGKDLIVKLGGRTLKAGTDYSIRYQFGTKAGKVGVTVTGKGSYTGKVTASFVITDPVVSFAARLYRVCLDREPEKQGLTWWVSRLKAKQETGGSCAWGFFDSTEFKNHKYNNSAFLDHAYQAFFDRRADTAGKNWWLGEMKKGMTRKDVITKGFAVSNEWKALCRKYGIKP